MVAEATKRFDADGIGDADQWTLSAGATKMAAVLTNDGDTTRIADTVGGNVTQHFDIDTAFVEKFAFVSDVRVKGTFRWVTTGATALDLRVRINTTNSIGFVGIPTTSYVEYDSGALARPGGGDWTDDDFRLGGGARFQYGCFIGSDVQELRCTELFVIVTYIPLNRQIDLEREVASRRLWYNREPEMEVSLVGGWEHLEAEFMDPVAYSHAHGPTYDAQGWGLKDWERARGVLKKQSISLSMPHVLSTMGDRRRKQTTFWEIFKATIAGDPDIADGIPRLDSAGADREFTRSSLAWVEEVGGVIKKITEAKEKIEPNGEVIEETRTNMIIRSSFINGTTGWVKAETTGTGTFAADTTNLLFDSSVTPGSVKMTITTAPYDVDINRVTSSLAATTRYTLSVDWEQDTAASTEIAIQNTTTSNFLQDNGTWAAGQNTIVLGTEVGSKQRDEVTFVTEGTASNHRVHVHFVGSTNGTVHNVFHVQVEVNHHMTTRIVTEAAVVTREDDLLQFQNPSSLAQRIWPVDKFTAKIVCRPGWAITHATGADRTLLKLAHDASNWIRLYFATSIANDPLTFEYRTGGVTKSATINNPSITQDTEHTIVIRKTSPSGELDLAIETIDVFLDGTIGTSDTEAVPLTEAASSTLTIGSEDDSSDHFNGHVAVVMVSPIVFSDVEISGGLA